MRYFYLFIILALCSCKTETERTIHTSKGETLRFADPGIKNSEAEDFFHKGLQSVEERDFYSAEEYFQKADAIEKDNSAILNALALTCEKFDNDEEAEKIYKEYSQKTVRQSLPMPTMGAFCSTGINSRKQINFY